MSQELEYRFAEGIEIRSAAGWLAVLRGLAAPFGAESLPLKEHGRNFVEKIRKGAFARTIRENPSVPCFRAHDVGQLIARAPDSLSLAEESRGLTSEIRLADSELNRRVLGDVRGKIAKGLSIGFLPVREEWTSRSGSVVRELVEVELNELSIVNQPAYPQTSIGERSYQQFTELRSLHPEILSATIDRGRFTPILPPVEYRDGEMVTVAAFRERFPDLPFVAEIASELRGFHDHSGQFVCDGSELREACRDPDAVGRALERLADRQEERLEARLAEINRHERGW